MCLWEFLDPIYSSLPIYQCRFPSRIILFYDIGDDDAKAAGDAAAKKKKKKKKKANKTGDSSRSKLSDLR